MQVLCSLSSAVTGQSGALTDSQLSDMHAAMRVQTEDRMESDISNFLFRRPDPNFESSSTQVSGTAYIKLQPKPDFFSGDTPTQQSQLNIASQDPKGFLNNALVNAQQPSAPGQVQEGLTKYDVRGTTIRDDFKELVTSDLKIQERELSGLPATFGEPVINEQGLMISSGEPIGSTKDLVDIRGAINERLTQVDTTYDGVITEIQTDINSENMDLREDGQLISERFGWESASEKMAAGEYGQTNGGIRGITDSSVNTGSGGGGGECCIFNEFGGGGCGPCR